MALWSTLGFGLIVVAVATAVTIGRHRHPGPKRRWLYETEDGERANPFGEFVDGAADSEDCDGCGATLDGESYDFCVSCGTSVVADD